jgi:predicted ArsR family transcriptional regulator
MKDPADKYTLDLKYLARSNDPETSKEAAESTASFAGVYKNIIQAELKKGAGTFEELAGRTGLRPDQVWRRLSDLEKEGRAFPTSETRRGSGGRKQRVWKSWE